MEKLFLPYELALEIKTLGFDEPCLFDYNRWNTERLNDSYFNYVNYNAGETMVSAPLFQQVFKWFREKYDLHSLIESYNQDENGNDVEYIYSYRIVTNKIFPKEMNVFLNSYEEAELECLKKLIAIVKNNN
jgi:hypothetical protein